MECSMIFLGRIVYNKLNPRSKEKGKYPLTFGEHNPKGKYLKPKAAHSLRHPLIHPPLIIIPPLTIITPHHHHPLTYNLTSIPTCRPVWFSDYCSNHLT